MLNLAGARIWLAIEPTDMRSSWTQPLDLAAGYPDPLADHPDLSTQYASAEAGHEITQPGPTISIRQPVRYRTDTPFR